MNNVPWILPVVLLAVFMLSPIVWLAAISPLTNRKHNKAMQELSDRLNMNYSANPDLPDIKAYNRFYLFKMSAAFFVENLMERTADKQTVRFFEHFSSGTASRFLKYRPRGVVSIHNPAADFPKFEMYPENLLNRACDLFAPGKDILFEHSPKFSRGFQFETEDRIAVRHLFSDQMVRLIEECKGLSIAASGEWIIFYRKLKPRTADQVKEFISHCLKINEVLIRGR
jgi:hypothetical protein